MASPPIARLAVPVVIATAALHLVLAAEGNSAVASVILLMMALVCLRCAHALWRRPSAQAWLTTAGCSVAMAAIHIVVCGPLGVAPMTDGMSMSGDDHASSDFRLLGHLHRLDWLVLLLTLIEVGFVLTGWLLTSKNDLSAPCADLPASSRQEPLADTAAVAA
jgi:hypothetical protein